MKTKRMTAKQKKAQGLVPRLRFPEFRDSGDWEETKLGSISLRISAGKDKIDLEGTHPLYGSTGIIGTTNEASYHGTVLLVARVGANAGFLTKASGEFGVTDNTLVIILGSSARMDFVYFNLSTVSLNGLIFGSGQPLITGGQLKALTVWIPNGAEQQKIADCLTSLDDLITAHTEQLEALKERKKGLLQNLFPREGERVPRLRFPKFRDAGDWKDAPLADVLVEHKSKSDGNSEVYSVSVKKGLVNQIEHLGRSFAAADTRNYGLVKPFDIVYTKSPTGEFPYGIVKQNLTNRKVIVSPLYGVFSPPNKYLGYLIHAYFESAIRTSNFLLPIIQKGAKNTIQVANKTFLSRGITLPNDAGEQQKIADCLTSLDDTIDQLSLAIEGLKTHKKALTQQLFPSV